MRSVLRKFVALAVPLLLLPAAGCGSVALSTRESAQVPTVAVTHKATTQPTKAAAKPAKKKACRNKGNSSTNTGERIYHVPGQQYYDETVITASKGERWFCTEAEAREAGWRKSKV